MKGLISQEAAIAEDNDRKEAAIARGRKAAAEEFNTGFGMGTDRGFFISQITGEDAGTIGDEIVFEPIGEKEAGLTKEERGIIEEGEVPGGSVDE
jgi:hypothetical protein